MVRAPYTVGDTHYTLYDSPCVPRTHTLMEKTKEYTLEWGGRTLSVRFPNWTEQANGSALVQYGDTVVLATAVMSKKPKGFGDFFPLMVDFQEKYYATGTIRGSRFIKRELRPADEAVLTARMIDRSLRPLFDQRIRNDVQIILSVLSDDKVNNPDILAFIGASIALHISDIPWDGPVAAVRVAKEGDTWVINPPTDIMEKTPIEILVAGTKEDINMLEAGGEEIKESEMQEGIEFGHENLKGLIDFQNTIRAEIGKSKKTFEFNEDNEELISFVRTYEDQLKKALFSDNKQERTEEAGKVEEEIVEKTVKKYPENSEYASAVASILETEMDRIVHEGALVDNRRVDGRAFDEVRTISGEAGVLPRTHGSSIFMRGLTHTLSTVTLASPSRAQTIENPRTEYTKYFMHHYNFPGFSVGEAGPIRSPGRREIGHGALAERALVPIIPKIEDFPYTIRLVSETLSSNGSSSMAAACASSLSLMDAGVPIKAPVAGIAIGLMSDQKSGEYKMLTDIQGPEDHYGDMDLKIAGTKNGITALQMDVKIGGITPEILTEALARGKKAREEILGTITGIIPEPRESLSQFAPTIETITINPDKIGAVIGAGGKTIKKISEETESEVSVEDDGSVFITGLDKEKVQKAIKWIEGITHTVQIGEIYEVTVVRIEDYGAFVDFLYGQQGLIHVSELGDGFVKNVSDVVKMGDTFLAKVVKIESGKIGLSKKQVPKNTEKES